MALIFFKPVEVFSQMKPYCGVRCLLFFVFYIFAPVCFAEFDANVGLSGRTYPVAGIGYTQVGYSKKMYGSGIWEGFTRLYGELEGTTNYLGYSGAIEVFPVSFLGLRVGTNTQDNRSSYKSFNCKVRNCEGTYTEEFVEGDFAVKWANVFAFGRMRKSIWEESKDRGGVAEEEEWIEPGSGLAMPQEELQEVMGFRWGVGYDWSANWKLMFVQQRYWADTPDQKSTLSLGMVKYSAGDFSVTGGLGNYSSDLKSNGTTGILGVKYGFGKNPNPL
jgi:hypothetical protein